MRLTPSRVLLALACTVGAGAHHLHAETLNFLGDDVPPPPGTAVPVDEVPAETPLAVPSPVDESSVYGGGKFGGKSSPVSRCCVCLDVGTIYLYRANPDNQILMTNPAAADAVVLETDDADLDWAAGLQFTLTAQWDACHDVQLSYFSINEWEGAATLADTGTDYETPFTGVGTFFRSGQFAVQSELQSFEANFRSHQCNWTWLYGFRYLNLSENAMFGTGTPDALVTVDVENHLYGMQIGGEGRLMDGCRLGIDVWGKAGVYYNDNEQVCLTSGAFGAGAITHDDDGIAFVGDAGVRALYCLSHGCSLYAGYQVLWLGMDSDGLALATKQFDKIGGPPATDTTGDAFYHGLSFGIEICH